jgi:hypothetical protein
MRSLSNGTNDAHSMTNEIIPHFHNDLGVPVIEIGAKKFMCMGALPPQDHPNQDVRPLEPRLRHVAVPEHGRLRRTSACRDD